MMGGPRTSVKPGAANRHWPKGATKSLQILFRPSVDPFQRAVQVGYFTKPEAHTSQGANWG
jgi:hypothetical protein